MNYFCSFSEAIRKGATIRPQGAGDFLRDGKTCSVGAGMEAIFGEIGPRSYDAVLSMYPYLQERANGCPACSLGKWATVAGILFHLNDNHAWSRARVADWLESYEESIGYVTITETEPASVNKLAFV